MKTPNKTLYAVLSLLPAVMFLVYIIFFVVMFINMFSNMEHVETDPERFFPFAQFGWVMGIGILMAVVSLVALIVFIVHVINNKSLPENERIVWVLVFVFAGVIGFPLYWFMRGIRYDGSDPLLPARGLS